MSGAKNFRMVSFMSLYSPPPRLIKKRSIVQTSPSFLSPFSLFLLLLSPKIYIHDSSVFSVYPNSITATCSSSYLLRSVPPPPFSFPKGMGKWKLTPFPSIVKKRMDNCLQLITKFAQRRACVTPRKNFAGGIMENTVDPKYGGGKWIEAKFKGKKKL